MSHKQRFKDAMKVIFPAIWVVVCIAAVIAYAVREVRCRFVALHIMERTENNSGSDPFKKKSIFTHSLPLINSANLRQYYSSDFEKNVN